MFKSDFKQRKLEYPRRKYVAGGFWQFAITNQLILEGHGEMRYKTLASHTILQNQKTVQLANYLGKLANYLGRNVACSLQNSPS